MSESEREKVTTLLADVGEAITEVRRELAEFDVDPQAAQQAVMQEIQQRADSEDMSEDEAQAAVVDDLASATGRDEDTIRAIVDGEIDTVPDEVVEGMMEVLDVDMSDLGEESEGEGDEGDGEGDDGEEETMTEDQLEELEEAKQTIAEFSSHLEEVKDMLQEDREAREDLEENLEDLERRLSSIEDEPDKRSLARGKETDFYDEDEFDDAGDETEHEDVMI